MCLEKIKSFFGRRKETPKVEEPKPTVEAAKKETPPPPEKRPREAGAQIGVIT